MPLEAIDRLHADLPRGGPGSEECTLRALSELPAMRSSPTVLDLGCGTGPQTLVLAKSLGVKVVAIDLHHPSLERLEATAREHGLDHLIETRCVDFSQLDVMAGSVDLIWSEGAAYVLGFEEALNRWRDLLAPDGSMAVSECSWLIDSPPAEVRQFWDSAYPAMRSVAENERRAERAGLRVLGRFVLPEAAWDEYYVPLADKIVRSRSAADREMAAVLDAAEREIDVFRRHGASFGYVFYLLQASG
ncbi:MAG TPA: class I SAM-dependent methyltransferase [Pirellulales bacterium]|nr:class I SAM-dependent methyltransferase [Pirellulales bacterium]